jgi:hypothetical protein
MMDIPKSLGQSSHEFSSQKEYAPVKNHNFPALIAKCILADTCSNRHIVEQTKAHGRIMFSMVTRWTDNRDSVFDLSSSNG